MRPYGVRDLRTRACACCPGRKSCAITTAKRLGQFLGDERIKDKGLNCAYVIAQNPRGTPTSERALPTAIFAAEPPVARAFLRKWCGDISTGPPWQQLQTLPFQKHGHATDVESPGHESYTLILRPQIS